MSRAGQRLEVRKTRTTLKFRTPRQGKQKPFPGCAYLHDTRKLEAQYAAKYEELSDAYIEAATKVLGQIFEDAAILAAGDRLGLGPDMAGAFIAAYAINGIKIIDGVEKHGLEHVQENVDKRLKAIVGEEKFVPWAKRYGLKKKSNEQNEKTDEEAQP